WRVFNDNSGKLLGHMDARRKLRSKSLSATDWFLLRSSIGRLCSNNPVELHRNLDTGRSLQSQSLPTTYRFVLQCRDWWLLGHDARELHWNLDPEWDLRSQSLSPAAASLLLLERRLHGPERQQLLSPGRLAARAGDSVRHIRLPPA